MKKLAILTFLLFVLILTNAQVANTSEELPVLRAQDESEIEARVITPIPQEEQQEVAEIASTIEYLGEFTITHYCACSKCCGKWADGITASGTTAVEGRTIAVDKNVIPLGSKVVINGWEYIAQDTGGAIKGNRIDIYVDDHDRALKLGKYKTSVYKGE